MPAGVVKGLPCDATARLEIMKQGHGVRRLGESPLCFSRMFSYWPQETAHFSPVIPAREAIHIPTRQGFGHRSHSFHTIAFTITRHRHDTSVKPHSNRWAYCPPGTSIWRRPSGPDFRHLLGNHTDWIREVADSSNAESTMQAGATAIPLVVLAHRSASPVPPSCGGPGNPPSLDEAGTLTTFLIPSRACVPSWQSITPNNKKKWTRPVIKASTLSEGFTPNCAHLPDGHLMT